MLYLIISIIILIIIIMIVSGFKLFEKARIPGYKSLIPIYNLYLFLKIADLSITMFLLSLIPIINIFVIIIATIKIGKNFNKKTFFIIGMLILPFIFYPILAFSSSLYKAEEENGTIQVEDLEATIYNQFPEVFDGIDSIPEVDTSILAIPTVPLDPIDEMKLNEESNYGNEPAPFNNIYSLEVNKPSNNGIVDEAIEDNLILNVDDENNTWQDRIKPTEEELTRRIVTKDSLKEDNYFVQKEKPVEVVDMEKFKICQNCHTKLDGSAEVCFLCGSKIEERK